MSNKQVIKDSTYYEIVNLIFSYPDLKASYEKSIHNWASARGSIVEVLFECMELHFKADYNTPIESSLIDTYRCLSSDGKKTLENFIYSLHYEEVNNKSKMVQNDTIISNGLQPM